MLVNVIIRNMLAAGRESYLLLHTRTTRRRVSCRDWKTNPRVSMNGRRLSGDDNIRRRRSLRVAKFTAPCRSPSPPKDGKPSLPLGSHAASRNSSLRPFSSTASSTGTLIAWTPPLETRPSPRVERVLPCALLGSPLPPPVRPPGVEIYSLSCPTLSIAAHGV